MPDSVYSPRLRTGVILCGTGTAGAYHAGVLRAIVESGIKIDVVAAHGAGTATALAAAIDGGARVWDAAGPWGDPRLRTAYGWRRSLRIGFWGLMAAAILLLSPLLVLVLAAIVYALGTLLSLLSLTGLASWFIGLYTSLVASLFDPPVLPTIVPRLVVLAVLVVLGVLVVTAVQAARRDRSRRRASGAFWWRLLGAPLDATQPAAIFTDLLWSLVRGASPGPRPAAEEIGRRYVDVLADNFGQPGFHEILIAVHDLDGRRDLVGAILAAPARAAFEERQPGPDTRDAEVVDFTGPQRQLLVGFLAGALRLPVVTAPARLEFPVVGCTTRRRFVANRRPAIS